MYSFLKAFLVLMKSHFNFNFLQSHLWLQSPLTQSKFGEIHQTLPQVSKEKKYVVKHAESLVEQHYACRP